MANKKTENKKWEVKIQLPDHQIFESVKIHSTDFVIEATKYFFENGVTFLVKVTNKPISRSHYYEVETGVFVNFTEKPTPLSEIFGNNIPTLSPRGYKKRVSYAVKISDFLSGTEHTPNTGLKGHDLIKFFYVHSSYGTRTVIDLSPEIDPRILYDFNFRILGVRSGWLLSELREAAEQIDIQDTIDFVKSRYKDGLLSQRLFTFCKGWRNGGLVTTSPESLKEVMENIDELEILIKFFRKNGNRHLISHINQSEIDGYNNLITMHRVSGS